MEQIIKKLLSECSYVEKTEGISYYSKEDKSFFFIISLTEDIFATLKDKSSINANPTYKTLMDGFKAIINSGEQITIEKNSSLILLIDCNDINAITRLQQQILFFEEDVYFFKKYVILYTNDSIVELTATPLLPDLRVKINNKDNFDRFAREGYTSEILEYLVIIQLFIKLPFLNFASGTEGFTSLSQKLNTALGDQTSLYRSLLENAEQFSQVDFSRAEDEARINELLSTLPHD